MSRGRGRHRAAGRPDATKYSTGQRRMQENSTLAHHNGDKYQEKQKEAERNAKQREERARPGS